MQFRKFQDFLKEREFNELNQNKSLNRTAFNYDRKLAEFNARFSNPKEGESVVKAAGYGSVAEFLADPNERKWANLRIPGQENYVRK